MIGIPQFLSHMAYLASPDRLRDDEGPAVDDGQGQPDETPAVPGLHRRQPREGGETP